MQGFNHATRLRLKQAVAVMGATVLVGFMGSSFVHAEDALAPMAPLALTKVGVVEAKASALETKISELGKSFLGLTTQKPVASDTGVARVHVAQSSRDIGAMNVRLGQLEEQIRVMTGQVEGLQFQMTQLQTLLERMQEDNEYRFQALEGGGLGKTNAAPTSEGATPLSGVPQTTEQSTDLSAPIDLGSAETIIDPGADLALGADGLATGLGPMNLGTLTLSGEQPLDNHPGNVGLVTEADATAQYQAGYDAVIRGDYAFAEEQFRQFIALFPDHQSAPDATNWLGEALLQRGDYEEAADILLTGFQSYPTSTRAPDLLLKLGMALSGSGENDTACRTFSEILRRYPTVSVAFKQRLSAEVSKAKC